MSGGVQMTLSDKCFSDFLYLVHQLTGITVAHNRAFMVEGRLRKRVLALGLKGYEDYLVFVTESPAEQEKFIDLITTNETYFFRTPRIWDYIEKTFLPAWFVENSHRTFQAWSAAASSGEEAHSLGIICHAFREKNPRFSFEILGTDISEEMIRRCQRGEYKGRSVDIFKKSRPEQFIKFMQKNSNATFSVVPEIKTSLRFQTHNLFDSLKEKQTFDLILLRNVLIYFTAEDQEKAIRLLAPFLSKSGVLIIGESESLSYVKTEFSLVEPLIYRHSVESFLEKKVG